MSAAILPHHDELVLFVALNIKFIKNKQTNKTKCPKNYVNYRKHVWEKFI